MTKSAASKVITKLESKKLAERRFAETNAKEQILLLTAKGKKLTPKLAALADANDHFFFGHLEKSQKDQLAALMQDLVSYHNLIEIPVN
jgi:DNA-binding MarR family transcriptional regulator